MGLVPNLEFMRINTKSPKFLNALVIIRKSGVGILNTCFLACPTRMGGPS